MTHLDDGTLLRSLDGESSSEEHDDVNEHLRSCSACRANREEIRDTLTVVANALARTDITSPKQNRRRMPRIPLAAAAAVLLAFALLFTPVRAWVAERARLIWNAGADPRSVAADIVPNPTVPDSISGSVSFFPTSEVFTLEVVERQEVGTLSIEIGDFATATATIIGELENENLVVLPDGLRILNSPASTTTYVLLLPASVLQINVIVASEPSIPLEPSSGQREWNIPVLKR